MNQKEIRRKQVQAIVYLFSLITIMIIARLTGYHGVTYVACAVEIYFFVSILVSGGVIDALSRILRSRNSKGQYRNAESMRRNAFLVQILFGILGTLAIWAMASSLSEKLFHIRYVHNHRIITGSSFCRVYSLYSVFVESISAKSVDSLCRKSYQLSF